VPGGRLGSLQSLEAGVKVGQFGCQLPVGGILGGELHHRGFSVLLKVWSDDVKVSSTFWPLIDRVKFGISDELYSPGVP